MKRIFAILLCLFSALPAPGAGVFDGSTSDLVVVGSATPVEYPVLLYCVFKATNATHRGTLISISDDGAGGSLDCLALEIRGDAAGDRINATSTAAGSSSAAATTVRAISAGNWRMAAALFESPTSRKVLDDRASEIETPRIWRQQTTERTAGDWTHLSVGALYNGGATNRFDGKIAYACVWFGADTSAIVDDPTFFSHNSKVSVLRPSLYLYQSLARKANDYADWGPTMTNNGVLFDFVNSLQ